MAINTRFVWIGSSAPFDRGSGVSSYAKELAVSFKKRGFQVCFACPRPKNLGWATERKIQFVETDPYLDEAAAGKKLLEKMQQFPPEVVINNDNMTLQNMSPFVDCAFLAVGHLEGFTIGPAAVHQAEWIDYVIAISSDMQLHFTQKRQVHPTRCALVMNGLAQYPSKYARPAKAESENKLTIFFCGEYSRRKGADRILSLLRNYPALWERFEFHWYGAVPPKLAARVTAFSSNIKIHGRVKRELLLGSLKEADIFLLPSRHEGCPMALLEAMSYGVVPVVSDGVGAMQCVVRHGVDGFVCGSAGWAAQAAEVLNTLSMDPKRLRQISEQTYERFKQEFTMDRVVDQLLVLRSFPTVARNAKPKTWLGAEWHRPLLYGARMRWKHRLDWRLGRLRVRSFSTAELLG